MVHGTFVPPTLIELDTIGQLTKEVFGPVLHVVRYQRDDLGLLIDAINALGYGLTLGIHSRIDETIDFVVARARVGNIYVNRNMIGAVVGVQPFGGEGLSGTGPKAGGPLYLERLRRARTAVDAASLGATPVPVRDLRALDALRAWANATHEETLAEQCARLASATPLAFALELPGPTGESNRETFHPRGRVLCTAPARAQMLDQLAAVLATGNRAVVAGAAREVLPRDLPRGVRESIDASAILDDADVDLVLCTDERVAVDLRRHFAARDGQRVRVVTPIDGVYPLLWLTVERVVSVNTAAAGGNASLMTLEPA
jgi:RHH-type proline utilization regulon transcriptional repressor/proline dehydrogenase/delta 1-pyrroline-5-carboxylate dehydrogenase